MKNEVRYPQKDAGKKIQKLFREFLDKEPSEALIQIINENNRIISDEEKEEHDKSDRAARQPEAGL